MRSTSSGKLESGDETSARAETAVRCHEIQVALNKVDVPEFDGVLEIGSAVRLALHIQGLALIPYEVLRLVAVQLLSISSGSVKGIVELLAEIEFLKIQSDGSSIKAVLPTVPYYQDLYETIGAFAESDRDFNEAEELSLEMVRRLARAPRKLDSLRNDLGAEDKLFTRAMKVGQAGSFLHVRRARGRDIVLSPTYFTENADVFADLAASSGGGTIEKALAAVRSLQGVPLSLVESGRIALNGRQLPPDEVRVLKRLAQDGAIKPPSIKTAHAGDQHFLFTPAPGVGALSPMKRDIYERAMACVAAVRQGQFLAKSYRIRSPGAVLYTLQRDGKLGKATTEAQDQYRNLVRHRIARLRDAGGGFAELELIDTKENREALRMALALVDEGAATGVEVDDDARRALQQSQEYVESVVASAEMRKREIVDLDEDAQDQLDFFLSGGGK